jgi:GT2 family glycosyltransferase
LDILLSVITVNFNGLDDTCALIDTILFSDGMEIIVVDNGSTIDEAAILKQRYPHITIIRSEKNLGFAGGNNLGIRAAHGRYLYFVNNDTVLGEKEVSSNCSFQPLIDRLRSDDTIGVVCPKIRFTWGTHPIQYAGYTPLSSITLRNHPIGFGEEDHGQYDTPHPTPYAHGAAMMIKRETIEKTGLMPECYFLYYEELDWSVLIRRAGYSIWYDPASTIFHKESQTTRQNSPLRTYYITRNRLLFAKRNVSAPKRYLTYAYLLLIVAPRDMLKYTFQRKPTLAKAALRGLFDFIRGRTARLNSSL